MNAIHIVTVLDRAWQALQRNHPELPAVVIVTGRRRHKSESAVRGQHSADTWHADGHDDPLAEIWISGERLAEGAEAVMQTLIHEAAHALARKRELQDTSNRGRYHNAVFVKLAQELGLQGPAQSGGPTLGFSDCTITKDTLEKYSAEVGHLEEACKNFAVSRPLEDRKKSKRGIKAHCQCPDGDNEIAWAKAYEKKLQEHGIPPILCGVCRQAFVPEDEEETT